VSTYSYLGTKLDVGDVVRHFDGGVQGRVTAVRGTGFDGNQWVEWLTDAGEARTSHPNALTKVEEVA